MKKFTISATLQCRVCKMVTKHGFKGMGESHALFFDKAKRCGSLADWNCPSCGSDRDHEVMALAIEEEKGG